VLIAPDAYKGSLNAMAAAQAIAAGWRRQRPDDLLDLCPMADGGDGFGPVLAQWLGAEPRLCDTVDAAGRPRQARWWWASAPRLPMPVAHQPEATAPAPASIALVESAEVIGLALLPPALRHPLPMDGVAPAAVHQPPSAHGDPNSDGPDSRGLGSRGLDSRGLAPLLLAAAQAGAERLLIGLGGSATNDGGFGLARALGWRFFDGGGAAIRRWGDLERLERVEPPPQPPLLPQLVIAVDVRNPLLGPEGATAIYGPQKGLTAQQLPRAEACLRRLAECLEARAPGVAERLGSGAAGGLGYGLQVFCGGRLRAGAELVAELCGLEPRLQAADLVIAGEGRFDRQSLMGKGTGRLLRRAQRAGRPSLLLVGQLDGAALQWAQAAAAAQGCAVAARALVPDLTDLSQACADPALWLERLAQRAAADLDALSLAAAP
jgi:glycerate kinase